MIDREKEQLLRLAERGEARGADEMIARLEARLEGRPVVGDHRSRTGAAERRGVGRMVLAAAAVVLLLVAVALFGPMFDDQQPVTPATIGVSPSTVPAETPDYAEAIGLAEAYIEALNAYDAAAARALLADDAFVRSFFWEGLDELEMGIEADRVWGFRSEPFECVPDPLRPEPGAVVCPYTLQHTLYRVAGLNPPRSAFHIRVADGLIIWAHNILSPDQMRQAWEPFDDWLDSRDFIRIFHAGGQGWVTQILTPEALAEAAALLAAYEEWASEQ
jgi:hypothetical protein